MELQIVENTGIKKAYSYEDYRELMQVLKETGATTGPNQSEAMVGYTSINNQRMKRLDKTLVISQSLSRKIKNIDSPQSWVVLTEAWCGDAAQVLPVIQKLAELNQHIHLKLYLRDENPEIMDNYLTNCSRSIPKLIISDKDHVELGTWGPRPVDLQVIYDQWKNDPNKMPYKEFNIIIQKWYNSDKAMSIQSELEKLLDDILDQ